MARSNQPTPWLIDCWSPRTKPGWLAAGTVRGESATPIVRMLAATARAWATTSASDAPDWRRHRQSCGRGSCGPVRAPAKSRSPLESPHGRAARRNARRNSVAAETKSLGDAASAPTPSEAAPMPAKIGRFLLGDLLGPVELKSGVPLEKLKALVPQSKVVYLHCAAGGRCLGAADILKGAGYEAGPLRPGCDDLVKAGSRRRRPTKTLGAPPSIILRKSCFRRAQRRCRVPRALGQRRASGRWRHRKLASRYSFDFKSLPK